MTAATPPTLTEFLLARLAEDEAYVLRQDPDYDNLAPGDLQKRWLAEVEAKRRIVEAYQLFQVSALKGDAALLGGKAAMGGVLADLAAVYSDHADYREEWRP